MDVDFHAGAVSKLHDKATNLITKTRINFYFCAVKNKI